MKLPVTMLFLRPGWWAVHLVGPVALFAGGVALGIFHATGHGAHDAPAAMDHASHGAPAAMDHASHDAHGAPPAPITGNPLRDEMRDLQVAFDTLNAGVVLGRADGVEAAFHAVHARREATVAALNAGTVRPSRDGGSLAEFIAQDDAFHAIIESTVTAARAGDVAAMRQRSDELRDACIACHETWRDPAAAR